MEVDYNINDFVYLYPDIHVDYNLSTNESIYNYINSNPPTISLSNVPKSFIPNIYLNNLPPSILDTISKTNADILKSIIMDGVSCNIANSMGGYVSVIHKEIYLISENLFSTGSNFSTTYFSTNEKLLIIKDDLYQIFASVSEIIDEYSFTVDTTFTIDSLKSSYILSGIYLYDDTRLALIKYLTHSNERDSVYYSIDPNFNPILYQTLYPESFRYTNERGYIDYIQNYPDRIGKTAEISRTTVSSNAYQYNELHLYNKLFLDFENTDGYLVWNNLRIFEISQDFYTDSSNLSTLGNNLITERAIKTYVDNKLNSSIEFIHDLNPEYFNYGNIDYTIDIPGKSRFNRSISIGGDIYLDTGGLINTKSIVKSSDYSVSYKLDNVIITFTSRVDNLLEFDVEKKYTSLLNIGNNIMIKNSILKIVSTSIIGFVNRVECAILILDENMGLEICPYTSTDSIYILKNNNNTTDSIDSIDSNNFSVIEHVNISENSDGLYFGDFVTYSNVILTNNLNVDDSDYCYLFQKNSDFAYSTISGENSSIMSLDSNLFFIMRNIEHKFQDIFSILEHTATSERNVTIRICNGSEPLQTYFMIRNFKYFTLNHKTWEIKKMYNTDYNSGSVNLDIVLLGSNEKEIAYNSLILGYVLIDLSVISDESFEMVFFNIYNNINNSNNSIFFSQGGHISLFDSTLNVNDNVIITASNTLIKGSITLTNNNLQIRQLNDGIIIDNKSESGILYIGSSNISVDNKGNLRSYGQIIAPYFSESMPSASNENVISELLSRVSELEDIVKKYNLFS